MSRKSTDHGRRAPTSRFAILGDVPAACGAAPIEEGTRGARRRVLTRVFSAQLALGNLISRLVPRRDQRRGLGLLLGRVRALRHATVDHQLGTAGDDSWLAVTLDGAGNPYLTGWTTGSLGAPNAGWYDVVLARYGPPACCPNCDASTAPPASQRQ
jgi:hypothetical protein